MPFEPAPKQLTLAEKLAAIMEAGRACHPDREHGRAALFRGNQACAMGFALLGAGAGSYEELASHLGATLQELEPLVAGVIRMNDDECAPLAEIIAATRANTLPLGNFISFGLSPAALYGTVFLSSPDSFTITYIGNPQKALAGIIYPAVADYVKKLAAPAAKVRTGKHGRTWPVAKRAYA